MKKENTRLENQLKVEKVDENNEAKHLAGAEFSLYDQKNNLIEKGVTNENGELLFSNLSPDGEYYLVETKAPNGYELDETKHPISFAGKADYTLTYRVKNKQQVQIGSIKIVKQDKESKKRLTGAEFKFRDTTNNYTATFTANRNGEVLIPGLAGDRVYEVTEIKAPNGYIIDRRVHKVDLRGQGGKTYTLVLNNQAQKGAIKIIKQDGYTKQRLTGAEFQWKDTVTGKTGTVTVGTDGTITIPNLSVNRTYEIPETKAPVGYVLDKTVHKVTLTSAQANKVVTVTIGNVAQFGSIQIIKTDRQTGKRLAGAVFEWKDTTNGYTSRIVTDKNGIAKVSGLSVNRTYELKEVIAPSGYHLDSTVKKVELTTAYANRTLSVNMYDLAKRGNLKLVKQDKDSRKRLAGAQFRWRDTANGNTGVVTANNNGEVILYNFSVNRIYEITEIKAPNGYILDKTVHRVLLPSNYAGKTYTFVKNNNAHRAHLKLVKQDGYSKQRLAGAQFRWRDTVNGNTGVVTANANGEATLYNFSVNRIYEITEIKAPNGYILDKTVHRVLLPANYAGKTYTFTKNNQAQKGAIKIIKQDGYTKQRLAGAQFKFRDTINNHTATFTANRNGEVLIPGLAGDRVYEITEIKAPDGYIIDRRAHKVDLRGQGGKTYTLVLNNQAQKGAIKIVKQDGYTKQRLAGAEFKFRDTINNHTATFTANRNGEVLIPGLAGDRVYEITEIKAPDGYIIDRRAHKVDLRGQGGKTYTLVLNNQAQKGAIKIIKQDVETKARLAGAEFKFRDTINNHTATFTANRNGEVLIPGLAGDRVYEITEIKAPDGYIIDRRAHKVDLRGQGGKTYTLVLNNQAQKGAIKIIKQDVETKARLAGAEFKFRDTINNHTATFTANRNGEVLIPGLAGDRVYEITEIKAPDGYIIDRRAHKVDLRGQGGKTYTLVLNNQAQKGAIKIIKQDVESKEPLAGAVFEWKDTTNDYTQRVTTGWDGTVTISGLSVNRVYEIREVQAPAGYSRNTTPTRVSLTQNHAGQTIAIVRENRKIPVYNPPPPTYWPGYIPPVTYYNPPVYYNPPKYYYRWCVMVIVVVCW
ncbi:MSCRAMM family protein [Enterococcus faecalis]|uniref:MSCRAMM family protein n=10 Tax=Enterococcus TaxID=1350 RepID=UPI00032ED1BA|nr:collagen adhesion protein [Enterococcus faecalis EnGen0295]EOL86285.1 collagen adhesion protein [Enterococcus faecalis EnGen0283]ETU38829.1 collagen adhesion protein [Enterococcus faecalis EnGen0417]ETU64557.1 collagen adhesion protein [Enterococcus faecalis EnGen0425]